MFVPKPKVIYKAVKKQDFFQDGKPANPRANLIDLTGKAGWSLKDSRVRERIVSKYKNLEIRRRLYIAFELRESMRMEAENKSKSQVKSKSRALGAVTIREGDAVPNSFYKKVRDKLDSFGLSQTEQRKILKQVKAHFENVFSVVGSEHAT